MVDGPLDPRMVVVEGGRILILAGSYLADDPDTDASGGAELFDPESGAFVAVGAPRVPRISQALVALPGGDALVLGGWAQGQVLGSVERYRAGIGVFELAEGGLAQARSEAQALCLPDGRVAVAGGRDDKGKAVPLLEVVSALRGAGQGSATWEKPRVVGFTASLLPDGSVLLAGGEDPDGRPTAQVERWDPRTGKVWPQAPLVVARQGHRALTLPDGRILLLGGEGWNAKAGAAAPEASVEIYEPKTGTCRRLGSLGTPRIRPAVALLGTGEILVAGGRGPDGDLDTTERFDPASGRTTPGPRLGQRRSDLAAAPLPGGRVLLLGGGLDVAERYE